MLLALLQLSDQSILLVGNLSNIDFRPISGLVVGSIYRYTICGEVDRFPDGLRSEQ